jgi:hypothetical protein
VAATFHESVSADEGRDVLVYVAFPDTSPAAHAAVYPAVLAAASALRNASSSAARTFEAAFFDGDANDAPPPHGAGARSPTLVLYPAAAKGTPRYVQRFSEGQLTLYDVLYFVAATAGHRNTSASAAALLESLPSEALLARPWETEAEEFEDEAWAWRDATEEEEEEDGGGDVDEDDAEL